MEMPKSAGSELSRVVVSLLRGMLEALENPPLWQDLLRHQVQVRDYLGVLGLDVHIDEAEGYAFVRMRTEDDDALPRLVARRPLRFSVSLLLVILRRELVRADTRGEPRVMLTRGQIIDLMRVFQPTRHNEVKLDEKVKADIAQAVELGFLRKMAGHEHQYEVRRILKAFVHAQWLADFDQKLEAYRQHALAGAPEELSGDEAEPT